MHNNYDKVAKVYDLLSRLVFRKAIVKAQVSLLAGIPPGSHLLIAGGGTGWILEELDKINTSVFTITYVELSAQMIAQARKRKTVHHKVRFVHGSIESFQPAIAPDVILTAFLFDNFNAGSAEKIFLHLHKLLRPGGLWLYTDFRNNPQSIWQQGLLKIMILFFRTLCHIEATTLTDMSASFIKNGYKEQQRNSFYHDFIHAVRYQKRI